MREPAAKRKSDKPARSARGQRAQTFQTLRELGTKPVDMAAAEPAGLPIRVWAFLLDAGIVAFVSSIAQLALYLVDGLLGLPIVPFPLLLLIKAVAVLGFGVQVDTPLSLMAFDVAYFTFMWARLGTSPGKLLLGLRIVKEDGRKPGVMQSIMRYLGYLVNTATLGLGFLWIAVDNRHRGWHDMLSDTRVVRVPNSV